MSAPHVPDFAQAFAVLWAVHKATWVRRSKHYDNTGSHSGVGKLALPLWHEFQQAINSCRVTISWEGRGQRTGLLRLSVGSHLRSGATRSSTEVHVAGGATEGGGSLPPLHPALSAPKMAEITVR